MTEYIRIQPLSLAIVPGPPSLASGTPAVAPTRQKRFAPRTRTGCLTCRTKRLKCDETHPICKRCSKGRFRCQYPKPKGEARQVSYAVLLQPPTYISPDGIQPQGYEIDLFGTFRSSLVAIIGGMFNNSFWRFEVPTAAQIYPSLWHGAIAITAIHKSIQVDKQPMQPPKASGRGVHRNQLYMLAIAHFNKSIQSFAKTIASYGRDLTKISYRDKEMILMTNILYIGLCGVLNDESQLASQCQSLINILEAMKFGEEDPSSRRGMMAHADLKSIVLMIDASIGQATGIPLRWDRKWVVKCPQVDKFTTITDAYIALLPTQYTNLLSKELLMTSGKVAQPLRNRVRLDMIESYTAKLDAFEKSGRSFTLAERQTIDTLQLFMEASVLREEAILATSLAEVATVNDKLFAIMDKFEQGMCRAAQSRRPYSTESVPYSFAPSYGRVLQILLIISSRPSVRWKGIELMRKWPFNESAYRSQVFVALYEVMMEHCRTGPERTLPHQQGGIPVALRLSDCDIDPYNSCECIPDYHICADHKMGDYKIDYSDPFSPKVGIQNWYEHKHDIPFTWYPFLY